MNVAFDPWIPVVTTTKEHKLISLCEALSEGENIADLAVRPHERVALMRLFLCVAHAALDGPKDEDDWYEVPEKLPEASISYLEKWKDSFELFHPTKPWLQIAELKPAKKNDDTAFTPLEKLDFSLASGATSTLFDHFGGGNENRIFRPAQLAIGLLVIQNFSTCGLLSRPLWNGVATPNSAKDAPCIASSMYHVFLIGKNLGETIANNISDFEELSILMNDSVHGDWLGRPVWEQMPKSQSDSNSTGTFLGRLVPVSRAIKFFEDRSVMLYGEGLRYLSYPDYPREFNTSVVVKKTKKKESRHLVGAKLNVRPWRQLDAILQYHLPAKTLSHAINLNHYEGDAVDIWVGALLRNPGKQDILDSVESRFHLSDKLRTEIGCAAYSTEVQMTQIVSNLLETAIYFYRKELDPDEGKSHKAIATTIYWTSIESSLDLLFELVDSIGGDGFATIQDCWRKKLYIAACEAYRMACGQKTPRQIRAFAKGWRQLILKKNEIITNHLREDDL